MAAYVFRVRETHIPRSKNHQADALSKLASSSEDGKPKRIQWVTLLERMIKSCEVLWLDRSSAWMDPIRAYLVNNTLLADVKEAE